jgi:hypothetical protein
MNTFTSSHSPSATSAADMTLGWNAMPAYGEIMQELRGLDYMDMPAPKAPAAKTNLFLESFWSSIRNNLLAMAA